MTPSPVPPAEAVEIAACGERGVALAALGIKESGKETRDENRTHNREP